MTTVRYGAFTATVSPAEGVTGFLLKSSDGSFFFRVYGSSGDFNQYGKTNPFFPALMRSTVGLPSTTCANNDTLAPGTSKVRSAGLELTMGASAGMTMVLSPSLYLS